MSKLRSVNTHFWSDNYIIELDPVDKLLFLYLLTNEHTNMLGVYELHVRKVAFDTGNPLERVRKAFERFEEGGKIAYVDGYVIMKNFMRHQNLNTNMQKSAINSFNEMPPSVKQHPFCEPIVKALKGFIKGSQSLSEYELELEYELEDNKTSDSAGARVKGCPIPEPLQVDGFRERYQQYWEYMEQTHRKQANIRAVEAHFRRLIELKEEGHDPLRVIDQTMAAGNKSFYPLKDHEFKSTNENNGNEENRTERFIRRAEEVLDDFPDENA